MFKFIKELRELREENNKLVLKLAKANLELSKYSEADRILTRVLDEKLELVELDISTPDRKSIIAAQAQSLLMNPLFKWMTNNDKYNVIMKGIKQSRDYPELVNDRSILLFIEKRLMDLKGFASCDVKDNKGAEDNI